MTSANLRADIQIMFRRYDSLPLRYNGRAETKQEYY